MWLSSFEGHTGLFRNVTSLERLLLHPNTPQPLRNNSCLPTLSCRLGGFVWRSRSLCWHSFVFGASCAITNTEHSLCHSLKHVQAVCPVEVYGRHNTGIILLMAANQTPCPYSMWVCSAVWGFTSKNILQQTFQAYVSSKVAVEHKFWINGFNAKRLLNMVIYQPICWKCWQATLLATDNKYSTGLIYANVSFLVKTRMLRLQHVGTVTN